MQNKPTNITTARREYLVFFTAITVVTVVQFFILLQTGWPFHIALTDAIISWHLYMIFSFVISIILKNYNAKHAWNISHFGIQMAFTVMYHFAYPFLIALFTTEKELQFVNGYNLLKAILVFMIFGAVVLYWWVAKKEELQDKANQQIIEQERLLMKAELDNIHQQIQPHFLFNSLNSIGALTEIDPKEANRMIYLLSDFLRGSLRNDVQTQVTLEEELEQAERYLAIEKIRFGHRLSIQINKDEACSAAKLPPLIIQPVLENAIKFGLYGNTDDVTISITATCEHQQLYITISNPYDPNWVQQKHGKGFGLSSIQRRLQLFYHQNQLIKTTSQNGQFITQLIIPQ